MSDDSSCLYDCSDDSDESSSMFALSTIKKPRGDVSSSDATLPGGWKANDITWRGPVKKCAPSWVSRELLIQVDVLLLMPVLTPFVVAIGFIPMLFLVPRALKRGAITASELFVWFGKILFALSSSCALINIIIGFIYYYETKASLYEIYGPLIVYILISIIWVSLSNQLFVEDYLRFKGRKDHPEEGDYHNRESAFYSCWAILTGKTSSVTPVVEKKSSKKATKASKKGKGKASKKGKKQKLATSSGDSEEQQRGTIKEKLQALTFGAKESSMFESSDVGSAEDATRSTGKMAHYLLELIHLGTSRSYLSRFFLLFFLPFMFATWQALIYPIYRVYKNELFAPVVAWYDGVIMALAFYCYFIETFFTFWMLIRAGVKFADTRNALYFFNSFYETGRSPLALSEDAAWKAKKKKKVVDQEKGEAGENSGYHLSVVDQSSADLYVALQSILRRRFNAQSQNLTPAAAVCLLVVTVSGFVAGVHLFSNNGASTVRNVGYMTVVMYDCVIVGAVLLWYLQIGLAARHIEFQQVEYLTNRKLALVSQRPHSMGDGEYVSVLETLAATVVKLQAEGPPTLFSMPISGTSRNVYLALLLLGFGCAWARYINL